MIATVAALAMVVIGAPTATAGGPTSVLVVSPESAKARAFYYSDEEYGELRTLVGEPKKGGKAPLDEVKMGNGRQINVTWMVHDISPWRLDRIFPDQRGTDTVWIHTAQQMPDLTDGTWHQAEHPAELRALLKKLGLMGKTSPEGSGGIFPEPATASGETAAPEAAPPAPDASAPPASTAKASTGTSENWWWSLPGLAAGALLALFLRPIALRVAATGPVASWRRRGGDGDPEPGPRQELRDL
ncbi:hypothetical protein ACFVT5_01875 [Streptomyces sp. NPDC058001]|uniref:hypothetical protein n=1 Tax=Streptomyces sp. NPDC058001 TaxID=3346300 RepID=UPI0036E59434